MITLNTGLQPVWDLLNTFYTIFTLIFLGLGVSSAFWLKNLLFSLGAAGIIFLITASLSGLMPELNAYVLPYFGALGIGLAMGSIVKWGAGIIIGLR